MINVRVGCVPSAIDAPYIQPYGVTVAQQILVLSVWVQIPMGLQFSLKPFSDARNLSALPNQ